MPAGLRAALLVLALAGCDEAPPPPCPAGTHPTYLADRHLALAGKTLALTPIWRRACAKDENP